MIQNVILFFTGKPSSLYQQTMPDWVPTVAMGHDKLKSPQSEKKRHDRSEKRESTKKATDAAHSLLLLQDDEDSASSGITEEGSACASEETQTDVDGLLMECMTSELQQLRMENIALKQKDSSISQLTLTDLEGKDERVRYLTGLSSFAVFSVLFNFLLPYMPKKKAMTAFQMLLMTLMRLRLNMAEQFLAYEFSVSQTTVSRIFTDVMDVLYLRLKPFVYWPERDELQKTMPMQFRKYFGKKVAVIIDCFEIFIERPSNLMARAQTWSSYKHHNTVKFLIAITPQGVISFLSKGWGGRVPDKHITEQCGFLNYILPGDVILADRGFDIQASVGAQCAEVKIPAFTRGKGQLSPLEIETTRKIANCRIHVERVIGCVRQKYTVLGSTLPIDYLLTKDDVDITKIDKMVHVCCSLTNLCEPIVSFD